MQDNSPLPSSRLTKLSRMENIRKCSGDTDQRLVTGQRARHLVMAGLIGAASAASIWSRVENFSSSGRLASGVTARYADSLCLTHTYRQIALT